MDKIDKILDKIGNYVNLDLKYYVKNTFYLISSNAVSTILGLLLSISFARFLSKEVYGQYGYIMSILGIFAIFTLPGMSSAIGQAVARGHDRVLIEATKEKFKWSILGTIAVLGVGIYYFLNGSLLLGKCFMMSSLFFPFYQNFQTYNAFFSAKMQFDKVAKYPVIIQAISVPVTALVIYFSQNLMLILVTHLTSFSLLSGYFFRLASKNMENESNDKEAISFGKHMTVTLIPNIFRDHYDKLFIGMFLGFSDLAVYSIAFGFSSIITPLRSIVPTLIFPKLSQMHKQDAYSEVKKRLPLIMIGFAILAGVLILLCPYIIPLVYSQKYADSIFYAQILLISFVFAAPVVTFTKALFPSQKEIKKMYKFRTANAFTEIVLLTSFTLTLGLLGAVIAKLLTRLLALLYVWWLAK